MKDFKFSDLKNEKSRVKAKCTVEDCPWCTHASLCPDRLTNKIKTYNVVHNYIDKPKLRKLLLLGLLNNLKAYLDRILKYHMLE